MARIPVKINRRGVKELLGSHGIRAELRDRAERVAAAAGSDTFVVEDTSGGYRAVAQVHDPRDGSMEREAQTGRLARALDAAR